MRLEEQGRPRRWRDPGQKSMDWRLFLLLWMIAAPALHSASAKSPAISSSSTSRRNPRESSDPAHLKSTPGSSSSSSSVVTSLMESQYTELMELIGRAGMLEPLEKVVSKGSITIFAPRNAYMEQQVDSEFKKFLLEPGNVKHLRQVLKHHIIPGKLLTPQIVPNTSIRALSSENLRIHSHKGIHKVELAEITRPDDIVQPDGVVHGVNGFLVPLSVQSAFSAAAAASSRRNLGSSPDSILPQSSPDFDPLGASLAEMSKELQDFLEAAESPLPLEFAMAPELAPAPAPGPSSGKHRVYTWEDVEDFVQTLANFGGYNEMAELLVNLTSFAWDMAKLVNEGHRLTLLAPNDHAVDHLTSEQLSAPGGLEAILMYHVLTEYQTEESLYNAVRRFDKVSFLTLHQPHKVHAREADGTVQFGDGEDAALLYDHDIFTDGHISIQGISKVLTPPGSEVEVKKKAEEKSLKRGRGLFESSTKHKKSHGLSFTQSIRQLLHL